MRPGCWTSVTVSSSSGRSTAVPTASRRCSCTAAPVAVSTRGSADCSTPAAIGWWPSTSAAAGVATPHASTPASRPERQHDLAPGRRHRAAARGTRDRRAGWSAAGPGEARWHWRMPRRIRSGRRSCVLRGIFTLRRSELDFYYNGGAGQLYPGPVRGLPGPAGWAGFRGDAIAAYHDLLFDPDPSVHGPAGVAWSSWEAATITLEPNEELIATFSEPAYALAFARIENHYFVNGGWFAENQLIGERRPAARHPRGHRPGSLRPRDPGGHRLGPASGLAGGRAAAHAGCRARVLRAPDLRRAGRRPGPLRRSVTPTCQRLSDGQRRFRR